MAKTQAVALEMKKEAEPVEVRKIRLLATTSQMDLVFGQSKICNWAYNALLSRLKADYGRFVELGHMLEFCCCIGEESDELGREWFGLYQTLFSKFWLRDLVPQMKNEHAFLRLVHSSPLKNAALRLAETFKQWRKRRGEGYGFPVFRSWSKDFFSLDYDEKKGWSAEGRKLHLSFGQRVVCEDEMAPKQLRALERKRRTEPAAMQTVRLGSDLELAEDAPNGAHRIEIVREGGALFCVFTLKTRVEPRMKNVKSRVYLDPNHKNFVYGLSASGDAFEVANRAGQKMQNLQIDRLQSRRDHAVRRCELVQYTREDGSVHKHWTPSNAWFRRNRALLREQAKRRDQNKTFVRTTLHRLFDRYNAVGLGDYTPKAKDHRLGSTAKGRKKANRSINNNSLLGSLQRLLPQVASKRGKVSYVMDEQGTTRTCHSCLHVVDGGIRPDIRSWICPRCGERHMRDENACQNGLMRLDVLLRADGLIGNPTCDAYASDDDPLCAATPSCRPTVPLQGHVSDTTIARGVAVIQRCDWTFDQQWSCGIVETPHNTVEKLFASARQVGQGKDRVQMKTRDGLIVPDARSKLTKYELKLEPVGRF